MGVRKRVDTAPHLSVDRPTGTFDQSAILCGVPDEPPAIQCHQHSRKRCLGGLEARVHREQHTARLEDGQRRSHTRLCHLVVEVVENPDRQHRVDRGDVEVSEIEQISADELDVRRTVLTTRIVYVRGVAVDADVVRPPDERSETTVSAAEVEKPAPRSRLHRVEHPLHLTLRPDHSAGGLVEPGPREHNVEHGHSR